MGRIRVLLAAAIAMLIVLAAMAVVSSPTAQAAQAVRAGHAPQRTGAISWGAVPGCSYSAANVLQSIRLPHPRVKMEATWARRNFAAQYIRMSTQLQRFDHGRWRASPVKRRVLGRERRLRTLVTQVKVPVRFSSRWKRLHPAAFRAADLRRGGPFQVTITVTWYDPTTGRPEGAVHTTVGPCAVHRDSAHPVPIALSAGAAHTCALLSDHTVSCWGSNESHQLGNDRMASALDPVPVGGLGGVTAIAAATHHTCALLTDGTVRCWGANDQGQLGDGSGVASAVPVTVNGLNQVTAIRADDDLTCALRADTTVWCWGADTQGQTGQPIVMGANNQPLPTTRPAQVPGLTGVTQIAVGGWHACALVTGDRAFCWGSNWSHELGADTGGQGQVPHPVQVAGVSGLLSIGAGFAHTCVGIVGGVRCFGRNVEGQLGTGTAGGSSGVVNVTGIGGVTAVELGGHVSCALLPDRTVRCWGENSYGQLGDGSTANRSVPGAVVGLSDVASLAAGLWHVCALSTTNTVSCWGVGTGGALPDGTRAQSSIPVPVAF